MTEIRYFKEEAAKLRESDSLFARFQCQLLNALEEDEEDFSQVKGVKQRIQRIVKKVRECKILSEKNLYSKLNEGAKKSPVKK